MYEWRSNSKLYKQYDMGKTYFFARFTIRRIL